MSKRTDKDFLNDSKEAILRINVYIEKLSYEEFLNDIKTQDAVVRNLEIIGEAIKNISIRIEEEISTNTLERFIRGTR